MEMHTPIVNNDVFHSLRVNGVQMGVVRRGKPSGAPALVLLHGFTGSAAGWGPLLDEFADAGLYVIALDMLGHGQSSVPSAPERYSIDHCRADILAALQQLEVDPHNALLLGYSMGGRVALYTALTTSFRALILESASPGLANPEERVRRQQSDNALAERIEREGIAPFIDYWQNISLFASQQNISLARRAAQREQRLNNSALGLANSLRGLGTGVQPALHARLYELTMPVLLIAGALDPKFCQLARQMADQIPTSQLAIVPDAGHTVHLEQPERFVSLVCAFYKATVSTGSAGP
ncbi:MAG: 2-succinyl-6-hydroxy-2,4-cyclohexadiene-1-carboxylate synthase [Ktedonobacteraceae bacterium]